jgi:hypothetical protein
MISLYESLLHTRKNEFHPCFALMVMDCEEKRSEEKRDRRRLDWIAVRMLE